MSSLRISQPITFARSGKTAPNVFLKSAMSERLATWDDTDLEERGKPTEAYNRLYEEWGKGQIGTIVLGNIACDRRYPEAKRNIVMDPLSTWDVVAAMKPSIAASKAHGSLVLGQITHGGRQTSDTVTKEPISSSDVQNPPFGGMTYGKPRPMTIPEIEDVIQRFAFAAKVLHDAGADGVQLHAAHGYLLSQFLSPRVNKRTDKYGGDSLDNRSRIVFETIEAVKAKVADPSFIISMKINSADFSEDGFSPEDSKEMIFRLEAAGVDLVELSGGTYETFSFAHAHQKESTKKREAYFIEFADRIRPHLKSAKLCVTGGFRSAAGMEGALQSGATDMIGIARPVTADPHFCAALIEGKQTQAKPNVVLEAMHTIASCFQIQEIGYGIPPSDFGNPAVAAVVQKALMDGTMITLLTSATSPTSEGIRAVVINPEDLENAGQGVV